MEHVYLTKKKIDKAIEMKQITDSEKKDLIKKLKNHNESKKKSKHNT